MAEAIVQVNEEDCYGILRKNGWILQRIWS